MFHCFQVVATHVSIIFVCFLLCFRFCGAFRCGVDVVKTWCRKSLGAQFCYGNSKDLWNQSEQWPSAGPNSHIRAWLKKHEKEIILHEFAIMLPYVSCVRHFRRKWRRRKRLRAPSRWWGQHLGQNIRCDNVSRDVHKIRQIASMCSSHLRHIFTIVVVRLDL